MSLIGICGDNCSYCPRYIATQDGSAKELEKVKEFWVRLGLRESAFPAQDMTCTGCRPENRCAYSELSACAREKGFDNCGLCDGYPCELMCAAFDQSDKLRAHAASVCIPKEMDMLDKAFFSKRQTLDRIHSSINEGNRE